MAGLDASQALAVAAKLVANGTRDALEDAYRIQLRHLGQSHTNTFLTLSRLVTKMVDDLDKDELALKLMRLELLSSSVTNIYNGEEARDWLVNFRVALADVYSKLGLERESQEVLDQLRAEVPSDMQPFLARADTARAEIEADLARMQKKQPELMRAPDPYPGSVELREQIVDASQEYYREQLRLGLEEGQLPPDEVTAVLEYAAAKQAGKHKVNPAFDTLIAKVYGAGREFNARAAEDTSRRVLGALKAKQSTNLPFMSNLVPGAGTLKSLPEAASEVWHEWNRDFDNGREVGTPWTRIRVRSVDEEDGNGMALAVLNLKGAQLDREMRLQRALGLSEDADVQQWRRELWRIQGDLGQRRNRLEELWAGVFTNWTDSVSRESAAAVFQQESRACLALAKELESLRRRATALANAGVAEWVTLERVASALPAGSVLVEFAKYPVDAGPTRPLQDCYGAVVLSPQPGQPRAVRLGKCVDVDQAVASLRKLVIDDGVKQPTGAAIGAALHQLADLVWRPLEALMPEGVETIFVNLDAELHLVPFDVLPVRGGFLGEKYIIRRISRAAVFGDVPPTLTKARRFELWYDPDYDAVPQQGGSARAPGSTIGGGGGSRSFRSEHGGNFLGRLGSAQKEASEVAQLAQAVGGLMIERHSGAEASEHRMSTMPAPFVLHLITHGHFEPAHRRVVADPFASGSSAGNTLRDYQLRMHGAFEGLLPQDSNLPAYRAAVGLAGANHAWREWRRGNTPPSGADGILMAFEAAQLDLRGTWLVALSACETGVGEVVDGEAVVGMQRGFLQAGALNVLYSLWRLDDPYSPEFMKRFYSEMFTVGDAGLAFAHTQRSEFLRLYAGREENLLRALRLVGPFALVSRAPQMRVAFPRSE